MSKENSRVTRKSSAKPPFKIDVQAVQARARQDLSRGAVTEGYAADREQVIKLLNDALATEIICVLRYQYHYHMASGIHSRSVAAEFLEHVAEEQAHAGRLAERITQLGGSPDFSPDSISARAHAQYVEGSNLIDMIKEDLVAERIAIEAYSEMIRYVGDDDPTTRRLLEEILAQEEEHAEDMSSLLESFDKEHQLARRSK